MVGKVMFLLGLAGAPNVSSDQDFNNLCADDQWVPPDLTTEA